METDTSRIVLSETCYYKSYNDHYRRTIDMLTLNLVQQLMIIGINMNINITHSSI